MFARHKVRALTMIAAGSAVFADQPPLDCGKEVIGISRRRCPAQGTRSGLPARVPDLWSYESTN